MRPIERKGCFHSRAHAAGGPEYRRRGFTLVELLVVCAIISALMAVLIPALGHVRRQARTLISTQNIKEITAAVEIFASDNSDQYPPSVATVGVAGSWSWQEPTMLAGYLKRTPALHRSISAYLRPYIDDADTLFCPNAPFKYPYLQEAWDAGDGWDHPETPTVPDAVIGSYCFYWNYIGALGEPNGLFRGPSGPARGYRESTVLVTDYFGYDYWRSLGSYGSCERFDNAEVAEGSEISSAYWARPGNETADELRNFTIRLRAGYVDGHVESYSPAETRPMRVIRNPETGESYPDVVGKGRFYLPRVGLR
jgi:prepilin-type N-terminal cleavage/methylation domain-containing protein